MSRYGTIERNTFRAPVFRGLPPDAKLVFLTLRCGPRSLNVPGLYDGGSATVAADLNGTLEWARAALGQLEEVGLVEVDDTVGLIRLTEIQVADRTNSGSTIIGWWRVWGELPESPVKVAHLATLRDAVDFASADAAAKWDATFEEIARPTLDAPQKGGTKAPSGGPPDAPLAPPVGASNSDQRSAIEDLTHSRARDPATPGTDPDTGTNLVLVPVDVQDPDDTGTVLAALNAARRRVLPGARDLTKRGYIRARLNAGRTVEECLHVIGVYEAEVAAGNAKTAGFFDSISPFRDDNFERALGKAPEAIRSAPPLGQADRRRGSAPAPERPAKGGVQ